MGPTSLTSTIVQSVMAYASVNQNMRLRCTDLQTLGNGVSDFPKLCSFLLLGSIQNQLLVCVGVAIPLGSNFKLLCHFLRGRTAERRLGQESV